VVGPEYAERRNLIMRNPAEGHKYGTLRTMISAYQLMLPGSDWHWHGVEGDEACMWLDILDRPLTIMLEPLFQDYHPDGHEPMRNVDEQSPLVFPWAESLNLLEAAMPEADGCFGARVELGASKPALPTLALHMQRLTQGQKTTRYRSSANFLYLVLEGEGVR
jgi:gentisate 1,2-dioxygenase